MATLKRIHSQPLDVRMRMLALDILEDELHEAVRRGLSARRSCDKHHPPSFPGTYQWAETHHGLRDLMSSRSWMPNDDANFSRILSPNGRVALTVATGDQFTGTEGPQQPATKYPRGSQTEDAIRANNTLSLFEDPVDQESSASPQRRATWVLLIHTDVKAQEVRYELSRPELQDDEGRVVSWSDRILFPSFKYGTTDTAREGGDDEPPIDVPVDRL